MYWAKSFLLCGTIKMQIYDITRELFSSPVYLGDPVPTLKRITTMEEGEDYTISSFSACCHNGTHMDAPLHAIAGGASMAELPLSAMVGPCSVVTITEPVTKDFNVSGRERILLRADGCAAMTAEGAEALAAQGVLLVGVDAIGWAVDEEAELVVHRAFLRAGVLLLEGITLEGVPDGDYLLAALPLKLQGTDGAPARAVLIAEDR